MLDICLLGTAGMMPQPGRWLTSMLARYNGSSLLIDCGEGTQIALKQAGFSSNPIDVMCFTHYHADHISGLPGMLLSMGNEDRTEELTMIGPKGLQHVVESLRVIAPELPFPIRYHEITSPEETIEINGYNITAFKVNHNVLCYGYTIDIKRNGRFDAEAAKKLPIPIRMWGTLQRGETVEYEGSVYTPDMVMGDERKGLKVCYCTDTRPTDSLRKNAAGADLLICEGMYAEEEKLSNAKKYKHMTFYEAAEVARDSDAGELWLTHFSPSLVHAERYMGAVRKIFSNAHLGRDGKFVELNFAGE